MYPKNEGRRAIDLRLTGQSDGESHPTERITPKVAALTGLLKGTGAEEEDYYHHLEEKHL
jgi:hypothetical protein